MQDIRILSTERKYHMHQANGIAENFMKNLGKLICSSTEERLNWKQELQKYLWAYRATPYTMTKHSPASLLFNGRRYKTHLPAPTSKKILLHDRAVRKKDASSKETMNQNADSKSYVKELDIKVGEIQFRVDKQSLTRKQHISTESQWLL